MTKNKTKNNKMRLISYIWQISKKSCNWYVDKTFMEFGRRRKSDLTNNEWKKACEENQCFLLSSHMETRWLIPVCCLDRVNSRAMAFEIYDELGFHYIA